MTLRAALAMIGILLLSRAAHADDAERAFHDALTHAAAGDPRAIDELERVGAQQPPSVWSDDAWSEAANLAERAHDYARARADLEHVVAIGTDPQLVRRARGELQRLAGIVGESGQWQDVAAAHERLVARVFGHGDPAPALRELEALVRANPGYRRVTSARIAIARGWEREGERGRAIGWLREAVAGAPPDEQQVARAALVRTLVRAGELDAAESELAHVTDRRVAEELGDELATARRRDKMRVALWIVLGLVVLALLALLRRDAGSWRAAARRIVRPPIELVYFAPIAVVLVAVSWSGNPLVARAVRTIVVAGAAIVWLSGVTLETARMRGGRIAATRAIGQAALAITAASAIAYLAVSADQLIDLVAETIRTGPAGR